MWCKIDFYYFSVKVPYLFPVDVTVLPLLKQCRLAANAVLYMNCKPSCLSLLFSCFYKLQVAQVEHEPPLFFTLTWRVPIKVSALTFDLYVLYYPNPSTQQQYKQSMTYTQADSFSVFFYLQLQAQAIYGVPFLQAEPRITQNAILQCSC